MHPNTHVNMPGTLGLRTLDVSYKHFKTLLKAHMFRLGHGTL